MKHKRFYFEPPMDGDTRKRTVAEIKANPVGNVVAVYIDERSRPAFWSESKSDYVCISATEYRDNSPVMVCAVSHGYLRDYCTRISEDLARIIHPELFKAMGV